jgi:hypothetical protein
MVDKVHDWRPTQKPPRIFQMGKGQPGHFLTLPFEVTFTGSVTEVDKGFRIQDRKTEVLNISVIFGIFHCLYLIFLIFMYFLFQNPRLLGHA